MGVGRRESGSGQEGEWEWAGGRVGVGRRESGSGQEGEWEWAGGRVGVGRSGMTQSDTISSIAKLVVCTWGKCTQQVQSLHTLPGSRALHATPGEG